jgi:hypothetical protein
MNDDFFYQQSRIRALPLNTLHRRGKGEALKKILSILLLTIFLFNWFGYRLLTSFLEKRANAQLELQLDNNNYEEEQLVSVKIPVDYLPYANSSPDFQRKNGQLEMKGIQYSFVKWRLYDDTLEFLCVRNPVATELRDAKIDFFKLVNDLQGGGQNKKTGTSSGSSKFFSGEYYAVTEHLAVVEYFFISSKKIIPLSIDLPADLASSIDYPPECHC